MAAQSTSIPGSNTRGRIGSIGASMKRARIELEQTNSKDKGPKNDSKKKTVVGTLVSNTNGRKMRSPPADIFVWGIHPDTTPDEIVKDLADSGIVIEPKDVVKKSKEGSSLLSFKISVRAEDLDKALQPDVWPL